MKNPVTFTLKHHNGSSRNIMIEPILNHDLSSTGVYKIYKTSIDNESALFTEELEIDEGKPTLPDSGNPDYLGTIIFTENQGKWNYNGDLLTTDEQHQLAKYLQQKGA
jgi:hypothetical protein